MCLTISKKAVMLTAEEDIIVYKYVEVLEVYGLSNTYVTPFRCVPIEIGKTYNSELIVELRNTTFLNTHRFINFGLHSFKEISSVNNSIKRHLNPATFHIVECVIPKGANYYIGTFNYQTGYASNSIKYVKYLSTVDFLKKIKK